MANFYFYANTYHSSVKQPLILAICVLLHLQLCLTSSEIYKYVCKQIFKIAKHKNKAYIIVGNQKNRRKHWNNHWHMYLPKQCVGVKATALLPIWLFSRLQSSQNGQLEDETCSFTIATDNQIINLGQLNDHLNKIAVHAAKCKAYKIRCIWYDANYGASMLWNGINYCLPVFWLLRSNLFCYIH